MDVNHFAYHAALTEKWHPLNHTRNLRPSPFGRGHHERDTPDQSRNTLDSHSLEVPVCG